MWDATDAGIRLATRRYAYDHRDGQAVRVLNHLHDKPLEVNMTHTLSERMNIALQKAEERVRSRK